MKKGFKLIILIFVFAFCFLLTNCGEITPNPEEPGKVEKIKLKTPDNIFVNYNDYLMVQMGKSGNLVKASTFKIYIYDTTDNVVYENSFNGEEQIYDDFNEEGLFNLKIQAIGDDVKYINSDLSEPVQFEVKKDQNADLRLKTPIINKVNVDKNNCNIEISNNSDYDSKQLFVLYIYKNNNLYKEIELSSSNTSFTVEEKGSYECFVVAASNQEGVLNSLNSNKVEFNIESDLIIQSQLVFYNQSVEKYKHRIEGAKIYIYINTENLNLNSQTLNNFSANVISLTANYQVVFCEINELDDTNNVACIIATLNKNVEDNTIINLKIELGVERNIYINSIEMRKTTNNTDTSEKLELVINKFVGHAGEIDISNGLASYWNDQGWCGSSTTASCEIVDDAFNYIGKVTSGSCWYAFQFFAKCGYISQDGSYYICLSVNINVSGKMTLNGEEFNLEVGDNEIKVLSEYKKGDQIGISIQFGTESDGYMMNDFNAVISGFSFDLNNGDSNNGGVNGDGINTNIGVPAYSPASEYKLVWYDEFDYTGKPDSKKWGYDIGDGSNYPCGWGWGNSELQYYTDSEKNAYVSNGVLEIKAIKEKYGNANYTSTRLISKNKGDFTYGYIEVNAKLPSKAGTWPAIWMLPTNSPYGGWPNSGEIDIMEMTGWNKNKSLGTLHRGSGFGGNGYGSDIYIEDAVNKYHLYQLYWTESVLSILVDNFEVMTYSKSSTWTSYEWPFDQNFHLLLNLAMGGTLGGTIDSGFTTDSMIIDYVRVYQNI